MWSTSASSRTRSRMPSASVISRGSWSRPARSSTAYSTACPSAPESSAAPCRSVSVAVRPSLIAIVRRTMDDTAGSCVTTSTVTPSSLLAVCSAPNTDAAVALSSSPVGSSASSTDGELASATAIATRCCSPPDIWSGRRPAQCATPSRSSSSPARVRRAARPRPASRSGRSTFCAAVRYGSRLRAVCCQTNPTTDRR